jgi:chemotaxis protein MotA
MCVNERSQYRELILEGIIGIADGENPRSLEMKLNGYLH